MSHLTQMVGLAMQNFVSAAVGIAVAIALVRGLTRRRSATIGNFWVDLTRTITRDPAPALDRVRADLREPGRRSRTSHGFTEGTTLEGATQVIPGGPFAGQEAIKELGTNGGGSLNANSAHPFENPNGFTNLLQIFLLLLIPFALTYTFGRIAKNQKQGWAVFAAMFILWFGGVAIAHGFEANGNPQLDAGGRDTDRQRDPGRRQPGREGSPLRRRRMRPLRGFDDRHVDRRRQLPPRQLDARRRRGAARQHDVRRGQPGRRRARASTGCSCSRSSPCSSPGYGRPHAGVPGQEDPGAGDEADRPLPRARAAHRPRVRRARRCCCEPAKSSIFNPGPHGLTEITYAFTSAGNNNGSAFGGLDRQHRLVQHDARARDARGPLPADRARARHRRRARPQADRARVRRHVPDRHAALRRRCSPVSCSSSSVSRSSRSSRSVRSSSNWDSEEHPMSTRVTSKRSLFDRHDPAPGDDRQLRASSTRATWSATRSCSWSRSAASSSRSSSSATSPSSTHDGERLRRARRGVALVHGAVRQLRRGDGRRAGQGAGGDAAQGAHRDDRPTSARRDGATRADPVVAARARRRGRRRRRRDDPVRRRDHRGHRVGRRVRDHRRIGAGDPRVGRRPFRRHRRHARAVRPDRRAHHGPSRARRSSTG